MSNIKNMDPPANAGVDIVGMNWGWGRATATY